MLGDKIFDPDHTESSGVSECSGMGLLPLKTVFSGDKIQKQTEGIVQGIGGIFSSLNGLAIP